MGEGNKNRERGTGKGTSCTWNNRFELDKKPSLAEVSRRGLVREVILLDPKKSIKAEEVHAPQAIQATVNRLDEDAIRPTVETTEQNTSLEGSQQVKKEKTEEKVEGTENETSMNRKKELIEKSVGIFSKDFFDKDNSYLKTILRRWPGARNLADDEIEKLAENIAAQRENVVRETVTNVYGELVNPEIGKHYSEEKNGLFFSDIIDNRVFKEMRSAIFLIAEKYTKDTKNPEKEKNNEARKEFSPDQQKEIETIKLAAVGFYANKLEESKEWEGFSDGERQKMLEIMMKGALRIQYEKRLVSIGAPGDSTAIREFIEDVMKTII